MTLEFRYFNFFFFTFKEWKAAAEGFHCGNIWDTLENQAVVLLRDQLGPACAEITQARLWAKGKKGEKRETRRLLCDATKF